MKVLSTVLALSSSIACIISAPSVVSASTQNLSQINEQIVANSIQLLKLSTLVRLHHGIPRSPWLGRRWFGYQLTNTTLTSTGALISGAGRFSYLHKSRIKRAPKDLFEQATWLRVGANADMVAGALTEGAMDGVAGLRNRRHGVALPQLLRQARELRDENDRLVEQGGAGVANAPRRLSDAAVAEFARSYGDAKARVASRRIQLVTAIAANGLSGACSYAGGIYAPQQRQVTGHWRTRFGAVGGIGDVIAGTINLTSPVVTRSISRWEKRRAAAQFRGDAHAAATPCVADCSERGPDSLHYTLTVVGKILAQRDEMAASGTVASHKKFVEQMAVTSLTAGSKIENGIGGCVGAFAYTAKPQSRFRISGASNIAYGASYAVASAELIRNQFWNELLSAKAHKKGTAPEQVLSEQLKQLEMLETHTGIAVTDTVH